MQQNMSTERPACTFSSTGRVPPAIVICSCIALRQRRPTSFFAHCHRCHLSARTVWTLCPSGTRTGARTSRGHWSHLPPPRRCWIRTAVGGYLLVARFWLSARLFHHKPCDGVLCDRRIQYNFQQDEEAKPATSLRSGRGINPLYILFCCSFRSNTTATFSPFTDSAAPPAPPPCPEFG